MTAPTPAQIEAARAEIKVALVGLSDRSTSPAFIAERLDCAYAALTAAAEVGDNDKANIEASLKYAAVCVAATIERCAQVVESYAMSKWRRDELAAAIRALKDQ